MDKTSSTSIAYEELRKRPGGLRLLRARPAVKLSPSSSECGSGPPVEELRSDRQAPWHRGRASSLQGASQPGSSVRYWLSNVTAFAAGPPGRFGPFTGDPPQSPASVSVSAGFAVAELRRRTAQADGRCLRARPCQPRACAAAAQRTHGLHRCARRNDAWSCGSCRRTVGRATAERLGPSR